MSFSTDGSKLRSPRYTDLKMSADKRNLLLNLETNCGSLLYELQTIWDEVGESDAERDRMLLGLEQECLNVYRRKVDEANKYRAQLRQAIADAEAELVAICTSMGERPVHIRQCDQNPKTLKAELRAILPEIEEMRKRRSDRKNQIIQVLKEIQDIKKAFCRSNQFGPKDSSVDEGDLSIRTLEELHKELQELQKEKSERLTLVLDNLNCLYSLCKVLGLDFKKTVSEIHLSLGKAEGSKNISDGTIEMMGANIQKLRELKIQRMQQLQDLATSLLELWDLMDTPIEEQQIFRKVTCNLVASEDKITEPDMLSANYINYIKAEVFRLKELKATKMKEIVLRKKAELEVICSKTHLIVNMDSETKITLDAIESGTVDVACVLDQIELEIATVREEALSRKEILGKVEKWKAACEEEDWLEEYNRDDNRYNAGRGAHLILQRAEKARALVNKLPEIVDALVSKTISWENEKGIEFSYDGVRLLRMLEEYKILRQEKELERKRRRDQKKLQSQLLVEQEAIYGSKATPIKNHNAKTGSRLSCGSASNKRLSLGAPVLRTPKPDKPSSAKGTPNTWNAKKKDSTRRQGAKDDRFASLFSGRIGLGMTSLPMKQQSVNLAKYAVEQDLMVTRLPLSPISYSHSSISLHLNTEHNEMLPKILTINKTPSTTPPKIISNASQENTTPPQTAATTVTSTPLTLSVAMQTPITPADLIQNARFVAMPVRQVTEYSFEERRAGFGCLDYT